MNSKELLYSVDGSSEQYTPDYAVKPILKYIPKNKVIWLPFDLPNSEYVKVFQANGYKIIHSHIAEGKDFFKYEPKDHWDYIVGNPPFKNKKAFFERALDLGKPFALLMTLTIFNDRNPAFCFYDRNRQMQLLKFDKRIHFKDINGVVKKKTTFSSGYICCDFLPKDLILEELVK